MKEDGIAKLKKEILNGEYSFMDDVVEIVKRNKILYTDNWGRQYSEKEVESVSKLEDFMHLLYRGSKHSTGNFCDCGFTRIIEYKGEYFLFKFYSGPETYVTVTLAEDIEGKKIVTMPLLQERLQEAEDVKNELAPIIEKYLKAGLTFEEITKMFVEIMRENRISL